MHYDNRQPPPLPVPTAPPQSAPALFLRPAGGSLMRWIIIALMLLLGVGFWLIVGQGVFGTWREIPVLLIALVLSLLPPVYLCVAWLLDSIKSPTPRTRWIIALSLTAAAGVYFWLSAKWSGARFVPSWHDELCYLIQTRMLAHGRLWMPPHPLGPFFDSMYLFTQPVYAPMYFPGTALCYVPGVWLHIPPFLLPLLITAASVGMFYRVAAQIINGAAGLIAALLLMSLSQLQLLAHLVLSHQVIMLLWLTAIWAWLRWRESAQALARRYPRLTWIALIGALTGWALITRPLDAICLMTPLLAILALDLWRFHRQASRDEPSRGFWSVVLPPLLIGALCAAPFLALQIIEDVGITGHWYQTPHGMYDQRYLPGAEFGFHAVSPDAVPDTPVIENKLFYRIFQFKQNQDHQRQSLLELLVNDRLWTLFNSDLPGLVLMIFIPLGFVGLFWTNRQTRSGLCAMFIALAALIGLYLLYLGFLNMYAVEVAPAVILLVVWGTLTLAEGAAMPPRRLNTHLQAALRSVTTVMLLVVAAMALPQIDPANHGTPLANNALLEKIDFDLAALPKKPAVVLFRYHSDVPPGIAAVYNPQVIWPDDAAVIRAHDLGPRNVEIFRYYAQRQPQREFYRYDEHADPNEEHLTDLGSAADLARRPTSFSIEPLPIIDVLKYIAPNHDERQPDAPQGGAGARLRFSGAQRGH